MAVGDTYLLDEKQGRSLNRIDTKANWKAVNPVLAIGEMGIEKDGLLQNIKIGDGVTPWNSLQYMFKSCPYEVGDILVTMNATDPAVRWPGTTWEVFAPGRVLIGAGTGTDVNGTSMTFAVGATGGEYSHQLTVGEMAAHVHRGRIAYKQSGYGWDIGSAEAYVVSATSPIGFSDVSGTAMNVNGRNLQNTTTTGGNAKHNNNQPYFIVYSFKRVK